MSLQVLSACLLLKRVVHQNRYDDQRDDDYADGYQEINDIAAQADIARAGGGHFFDLRTALIDTLFSLCHTFAVALHT